jgi:DNA-binding PadR family transcriptional regulator
MMIALPDNVSCFDIMNRNYPRVDFLSLHILHHAGEGPVYGLWMMEELRTHGYRIGPSQLYPRFHRLEQQGYLKRDNRVMHGKVRKYYELTAEGCRYLEEQNRRLIELGAETLSAEEIQTMLRKRLARPQK